MLNFMHCRGEEEFMRGIPNRSGRVKKASATNYRRFVAVIPSVLQEVLKPLPFQPVICPTSSLQGPEVNTLEFDVATSFNGQRSFPC